MAAIHAPANLGRAEAPEVVIAASKTGARLAVIAAPDGRAGRLYHPRMLKHRIAAYAAIAAVGSWSRLTASGGLNPCRSMSLVT